VSRDDRLACEEALGDVQRFLGALVGALAHYRRAQELAAAELAKMADLERKEAVVLEHLGFYSDAIDVLEQAVAQIDPTAHSVVYYKICMQFGMIYIRLLALEKADRVGREGSRERLGPGSQPDGRGQAGQTRAWRGARSLATGLTSIGIWGTYRRLWIWPRKG